MKARVKDIPVGTETRSQRNGKGQSILTLTFMNTMVDMIGKVYEFDYYTWGDIYELVSNPWYLFHADWLEFIDENNPL